MASTSPHVDPKSGKKRKNKPEGTVANGDTASHASDPAPPTTDPSSAIESSNPHMKELNRQIRNVHKKLAASSKADSVILENPGKSLDELVAAKKLNADQKAQVLKKPQLQSQLVQLEEQLSQFRAFAQELEERFNQEKAMLIQEHETEVTQLKQDAGNNKEEPKHNPQGIEEGLKIISDFLHAAAFKRSQTDLQNDLMDEARAFEGALLLVYQGNEASITTLHNLIDGTDDKVPDTEGNLTNFTYAQLKQAAVFDAQEINPTEQADLPTEETPEISSDPTITNAAMTELEDTTTIPIRPNGFATSELESVSVSVPEQTSTTAEAANATAEAGWNPELSITTDASGTGEEWVQVPRDPAETETGIAATPAAQPNANSWAEEVASSAEEPKKENDGFEPVRGRHGDARGRGRGGRGGRAPRGDFRGRGRGDGRGRGGPYRGRAGARESRGDRQ